MQLIDRTGNKLYPIYKYEVQPISGYTFTFIRQGNTVDVRFKGVCSRNQGYQDLGSNIPQGFRPIQEIRAYFDNVVNISTNGSGFWNFKIDGSIVSFSTTSNSVEKVGNVTYLTNDPMPSDSYLMEE